MTLFFHNKMVFMSQYNKRYLYQYKLYIYSLLNVKKRLKIAREKDLFKNRFTFLLEKGLQKLLMKHIAKFFLSRIRFLPTIATRISSKIFLENKNKNFFLFSFLQIIIFYFTCISHSKVNNLTVTNLTK